MNIAIIIKLSLKIYRGKFERIQKDFASYFVNEYVVADFSSCVHHVYFQPMQYILFHTVPTLSTDCFYLQFCVLSSVSLSQVISLQAQVQRYHLEQWELLGIFIFVSISNAARNCQQLLCYAWNMITSYLAMYANIL